MANHYKRSKKPATIARKQQRSIKSRPNICLNCDGLGIVIRSRFIPEYGRYMPLVSPCHACKPGRVPLTDRKTAAAGGAA